MLRASSIMTNVSDKRPTLDYGHENRNRKRQAPDWAVLLPLLMFVPVVILVPLLILLVMLRGCGGDSVR
jgi:hypothetical protein